MTETTPNAPTAREREEPAIAWLRRYCWGQGWTGIGPSDDYNIFGSLKLSHLRDALAAFDAALLAARREVEVLRRALIAHRADLHNGSKRPCPTCYQSAHALDIADKVPNSCAYAETDRAALAATQEEK